MGQLNLAQGEAAGPAYQRIWQLLEGLPHETLLELRGESPDSLTQGWIDLALAAHAGEPKNAIAQWRSAYPDHPAPGALLQRLAEAAPAAVPTRQFTGTVALLLPLDQPAYAAAAEAVQAGLMAARGDAANSVKVYPSRGDGNAVVALYQQAVSEGAQYVVGPMVREEVNALAAAKLNMVPTLALNAADQEPLPENLLTFGLPVEAEAMQVAQLARARGMQSAILVAADTPLSKRMEQAFLKEWKAQQGTVVAQESFASEASLAALKADLANHQADMIFLAANVDQARLVRPCLDPATPTFAISHIYDGLEQDPENAPLSAIHFVDMPWLVNPDHPDFAPYREAAAKLPPGEAQRWFAVGVDAWHILAARAAGKSLLLPGLSGTLHMDGNTINRELSMAQFRSAGVVLEQSN
ncbi:penicillin-binding protein activator LpoA precursor [mine drainage metagenome]|uniref:Penicillin-binding protein activator LpoA n=1 Tax=mine drainage metagenome TaxID=410659 RepID=A0A1J5QFS4_9ZZZZ